MLVLLLVVVALVRDQGGWDLEHLRGEAAEVEASKLDRNTPGTESVTGTEIVTVQLSGTRLSRS